MMLQDNNESVFLNILIWNGIVNKQFKQKKNVYNIYKYLPEMVEIVKKQLGT